MNFPLIYTQLSAFDSAMNAGECKEDSLHSRGLVIGE